MLPPLTILINAFGRTWILAEAIEAAIQQEYPNGIEILVVNDFEMQTLKPPLRLSPGRHVRVVNLPQRHKSLGEKRNAGIALATYDTIVMADDDDIMLPWAARDLVTAHMETGFPAWADKYFYTERWPPDWKVQNCGGPSAQHGLITKHHWESVGKFASYSTRDDIDFFGRMRDKYGDRVVVPVERPGYLYRWSTNTHHLAGSGNCCHSWQKALDRAMEDIRTRREKSGIVTLLPQLRANYVEALKTGGYL